MTSDHALQLVDTIIQNDLGLVAPLLTLLYTFRGSRGDPLGEAMMSDVLRALFAKSDQCELYIKEMVDECVASLESSDHSIAA